MIDLDFTFDGELWIYPGPKPWHFVTLPVDIAEQIKIFQPPKAGFGSVRVSVTIGSATWQTSLFPAKEANSYILPVKADIRKKEKLSAGGSYQIRLDLRVDGS